MSKADKRRHAKDRRRRNEAAARAAEAKRKRIRTVAAAFLAVALIGGVALLAGAGLGGSGGAETASSTRADGPEASETGPGDAAGGQSPPLPDPPSGTTISGATTCPPVGGADERVSQFAQAPPTDCIDPARDYTATVETSEGSITMALTPDQAPVAVNNFAVLARYRYFEGLPFHRVATGFVDQTGSSGIPDYGKGGPGYSLPEEPPTRPYEPGDVAMARAQEVSGSQFFFTLDPASLNGVEDTYPLIGTVTEGMETVEAINALAPPSGDGAPTKVVTIESVTVTEP